MTAERSTQETTQAPQRTSGFFFKLPGTLCMILNYQDLGTVEPVLQHRFMSGSSNSYPAPSLRTWEGSRGVQVPGACTLKGNPDAPSPQA